MSYGLFLSDCKEIEIVEVRWTEENVIIVGQSIIREQACPHCGVKSRTVHSHYQRHPQDLPSQGVQVRVQLQVKRFRCTNPECPRATFAERLPTVVGWHQHRTVRLERLLEDLAFELGGEAGSRCLHVLAIPLSGDTLLRVMRKYVPPVPPLPTAIGVDDWAYRRGMKYGSLIVDLDTHQPIAVLPDREPETLATWLRQQPQLQWVSRDRSKTYAEGIRQGAPQALQVTDRWHLLKNLREALNQTLLPFGRHLRTISLETITHSPARIPTPTVEKDALDKARQPLRPIEQLRHERRRHWEALFQQVHQLLRQGWSVSAIARHLHVDRKTVIKYRRFDELPPKTCIRLGPRILDPFRAYMQARLLQENPSGRQLFVEIQAQGYTGCKSRVTDYVSQIRRAYSLPNRRRKEIGGTTPPLKTLTAPTLATLSIMDEHQRTLEQSGWIQDACHLDPGIAQAVSLTQAFAHALRTRQQDFLDEWVERVRHSGLQGLKSFANGLTPDYDAIRAAFSSPYSNGQLEGQITRLKLLKRQMYGRAKFDLLRLRVLRP
ncbi:MAG: ISL3 family transposase [Chloroflexota bacterium]